MAGGKGDLQVSREAVKAFLSRTEELGLPVHSFLLYWNGELAAEVYRDPYGPEKLHRMFSVTKSFVSLAVGLLADQGRILLDDPVIRYFPEYLPEQVHPWLAGMTIRHMLRMQTCHRATTYKRKPDRNWVESFFVTEPDHAPGVLFQYDTSAAHTLGALVEKETGMALLDFLRLHCLDRIGFSRDAYIMKDPFGVSMGGSGLMATPLDLMRLGIFLLNGGRWAGRQIYPAWYLSQAVRGQVQTAFSRSLSDERQGYGYQFWRFRQGGYGCFGKGGQYLLCFPGQDMVCVITADTQEITGGHQQLLDCLYGSVFPGTDNPGGPGGRRLYGPGVDVIGLEPPYVPDRCRSRDCVREQLPAMDFIGVTGSGVNCRTAAGACVGRYRAEAPGGYFSALGVTLDEDGNAGTFFWECPSGERKLRFGVGSRVYSDFPDSGAPCWAWAIPVGQNTLFLKWEIAGEDCCSVRIELVFGCGRMSARMQSTGETAFLEFSGFFDGIKEARSRSEGFKK